MQEMEARWTCDSHAVPYDGPPVAAPGEALRALGSERATLLATLGALGVPFLVAVERGRLIHESPAATAMLARTEAPEEVRNWVGSVAARVLLREGWRLARLWQEGDVAADAETLQTRGGSIRAAVGAVAGRRTVAVVVLHLAADARDVPDPAAALAERLGLSAREADVLRLVADGLTTEQVAEALGISPHTVKRHTERVFAKAGVRTRARLAALLHGGASLERTSTRDLRCGSDVPPRLG